MEGLIAWLLAGLLVTAIATLIILRRLCDITIAAAVDRRSADQRREREGRSEARTAQRVAKGGRQKLEPVGPGDRLGSRLQNY